MPRSARSLSIVTILIVQAVFVVAVAVSYATLPHDEKTDLQRDLLGRDVYPATPIERTTPLVIEPLYDDPNVVSDEELAGVLRQLQPRFPREKMKPNFVEHALRTWRARAKFSDPKVMSGAELVEFLVNHGRYAKSWDDGTADRTPLLEARPHGIAIRIGTDPNESVHHDHWLASLTEAGVTLDTPIFAPGRVNATFNDVLQEALRDFRLDERETEWSAMAFGLWIVPQKSWMTTAGREISFDMLARRLIRGDKRHGVCNGTHRVYSLTVLLRLDEQFDILSDEVHAEVWAHLESVRDLLKVSQLADGHWPTNWSKGEEAVIDPLNDLDYRKVIATGHHLEWLAIAPIELHPPREQIIRAAKWVSANTVARTESEILERYTFYSHVANALSLWRKTNPPDYWMAWEAAHPGTGTPPPGTPPAPPAPSSPEGPKLPPLPAAPAP